MEQIEKIRQAFTEDLSTVGCKNELEEVKIKYLGKKGQLQELMQGLKNLSKEERPIAGKSINELKEQIVAKVDELDFFLIEKEEKQRLSCENIDITMPGRAPKSSGRHLLTKTLDDILDILVGMGFSVQVGPDIDSDYYNFEALNFPEEHPARDMQDTFYINKDYLLRTHTSNIQARVMEKTEPPIRIVAPGKVFRNETITARSHVFFHQVEALYIDKNVTFCDLLSTMRQFFERIFGKKIETRFRPSFFPFVEPGMEVDISCLSCQGSGCMICKHTGWLEVAGAGMVHPEVLKAGNIDPEEYSGYAWGLGVERLTMLKYGVNDIRLFTENDLRFLKQFS